MSWLARYQEATYAALRVAAGFLFACHGAQKLFGALGGKAATDPLMVAAGWIELVGGSAIALGLLTPWIAFLASGEMAVAYFKAHAPQGPWPIENRGELAVLYAFLFLYFAAKGSGAWSLDALWSRRLVTKARPEISAARVA